MQTRLIERAVALCLAAAVTLAMLGGIDQLAQRSEAASQWAQQASHLASHQASYQASHQASHQA